jgi:hypothetical protein
MEMKNTTIAAAIVGSFALGVAAASVLYAQGTVPYYEVAEINVKDQAGYEGSGVDKVREAINCRRQGDRRGIQEGRAYCREW